MGDINQVLYLTKLVPRVSGAILEILTKDHNNALSFRDHYAHNEYVGIGAEGGDNVDVVVDLAHGVGGLRGSYFALGICCSVLEHVRKPWQFAEHLTGLIDSAP